LIFLDTRFCRSTALARRASQNDRKSGFCTIFGSICTPENPRGGRDDRMSRGLGKLQREIIETLDAL
jgi:hypothetical protein